MALKIIIKENGKEDKTGYLRIYSISNFRGQGQFGGNHIEKFSYTILYKIHDTDENGLFLSGGQFNIQDDGNTNYGNIYQYSYNKLKEIYPDAIDI